MYPVLFQIGPITIYSYGLMLACAFLLCGHLYARELGRRGLDPELAGVVVTWAVVGGLAGARIYYLIENWRDVKTHLLGAIFSGAGLVAYGGFAGGITIATTTLPFTSTASVATVLAIRSETFFARSPLVSHPE